MAYSAATTIHRRCLFMLASPRSRSRIYFLTQNLQALLNLLGCDPCPFRVCLGLGQPCIDFGLLRIPASPLVFVILHCLACPVHFFSGGPQFGRRVFRCPRTSCLAHRGLGNRELLFRHWYTGTARQCGAYQGCADHTPSEVLRKSWHLSHFDPLHASVIETGPLPSAGLKAGIGRDSGYPAG